MAENIVINFDANVTELTKAIDILEKMGLVAKKDADAFKALGASSDTVVQGQNKIQKELTETEKSLAAIALQSQKTNALLSDSGGKVAAGTAKAKAGLGDLDQALGRIGTAIVGAFAIERVIAFGAESVKAFQEAERNALILKSAVGVNGGLQEDFEDLLKQSEELQKITIFSDDSIQQAQTAALQFGLTKDQVKALIPVVADFASATGQDLKSALDGVLQGVNGVGRGLKIYGVTIDENQTATERLSDITGQLTKKFEDQAEAVGKTAFGAAEKYKNEIDDLQESIGERLSPVLTKARGVILDTSEALLELVGAIDSAGADDEFQKFVNSFKERYATTGIDELMTIYLDLVKIQDKVTGSSRTVVLAQKQAIIELMNAGKTAKQVPKDIAEALESLKNVTSLTNEELLQIKKTLESVNDINLRDEIALIEKTIEARKKAGEKAVADQKKAAEELNEIQKQASEKYLLAKAEEVSEVAKLEQQKILEIKKINDAFIAAGSPTDELKETKQAIKDIEETFGILIANAKEIEIKTNIEKVNKEFQEFRAALNNLQTQKEIDLKVKFIQAGDFSDEAFKKLQDDILAASNDTFDMLIQQAKAYGVDQKTIDDLILANKLKNINAGIDAEKEANEKSIEMAKQRAEQIKIIQEGIIQIAQETLNAISDITNAYYENRITAIDEDKERILESYDEQIEKNEELHDKNKKGDRQYENDKKKLEAERKKAEEKADKEKKKLLHDQAVFNKELALAQAILNTALAVTNAISTGDPYTAALRAAIVAAIGAIEIAAIAAQPIPSYAKGKEKVEGQGTDTSDNIHVMLSPGERVVAAKTNRKYFPILSAIHREQFDPEAMNRLTRFSPEALRELAHVDPLLIHELATMQPVSFKKIDAIPDMRFRPDLTPILQARYESRFVSRETEKRSGLTEWDIKHAVSDLTINVAKDSVKQIGKEVAANMETEYSIRRRI